MTITRFHDVYVVHYSVLFISILFLDNKEKRKKTTIVNIYIYANSTHK